MFFSWRNKENRPRSHRPFFLIHLLLSPSSQIQKQLPMGMPMGSHPIERLQVPVDPKRSDRPVPTAQLQVSQEQWLQGSLPKWAFRANLH
jgi:hypothetical protein